MHDEALIHLRQTEQRRELSEAWHDFEMAAETAARACLKDSSEELESERHARLVATVEDCLPPFHLVDIRIGYDFDKALLSVSCRVVTDNGDVNKFSTIRL